MREEFAIDQKKNAHFFTGEGNKLLTGVNKTKRRRRSLTIRKAVPHSNITLLLPYGNFPKSVFCSFIRNRWYF